MTRTWLAAGILAAWVGSLGWLAQREIARRASGDLAGERLRVAPGTQYYAVYVGDRQYGMQFSTIDTTPAGFHLNERYVVQLPVGPAPVRAAAITETGLSRELALLSFTTSLRQGGPSFYGRGQMMAERQLRWQFGSSRTSTPEVADATVGVGAVPLDALPFRVAFSGRMEVGRTVTVPAFDPSAPAVRTVTVRVAAESVFSVIDSAAIDTVTSVWHEARRDTIRAWRLDIEGTALPARAWVDAQGHVVEAVSPFGLRLVRSAFELIRAGAPRSDSAAARLTGAAEWVRYLDAAPAPRARLAVQLALGDAPAEAWRRTGLHGSGQELRGDTLLLGVETPAGAPLPDSARAGYLRAEPLIPAGHADVRALAGRVTAGVGDGRLRMERLARWTASQLAFAGSFDTAPDAVAALRARRGAAASHALLFVALARAADLPARTAAGFVLHDGRWRAHLWAEVFLDRWVAVDPTFGRVPVDAAYLRVFTGGAGRPAELIPLAARLRPALLPSPTTR